MLRLSKKGIPSDVWPFDVLNTRDGQNDQCSQPVREAEDVNGWFDTFSPLSDPS
jgi:hypothetical protein